MSKTTFDYSIPISQSEEEIAEFNRLHGTNFKTTEAHVNELLDLLVEKIEACGNLGGWYVGDSLKVKIEIEYCPEDK